MSGGGVGEASLPHSEASRSTEERAVSRITEALLLMQQVGNPSRARLRPCIRLDNPVTFLVFCLLTP